MSFGPARPDIPAGGDFSLRWFGIPDKQVLATWKWVESLPNYINVRRTRNVAMDVGTRVLATASIEQGMTGTVANVMGDLRRVNFEHHWADLHICQLMLIK